MLFSGPMVRALLAGQKTQTRRIVKGAPDDWAPMQPQPFWTTVVRRGVEEPGKRVYGAGDEDGSRWLICPYGQPGDRLWVRESWSPDPRADGSWDYAAWAGCREGQIAGVPERFQHPAFCNYAANWLHGQIRWTPSIHMPRWASRILLEVVSVRVERLQAISKADAQAEGIFFTDYGRKCGHTGKGWTDVGSCPAPAEHHPQRPGWFWKPTTSPSECLDSPINAFGNLWIEVNGDDSWDANPWVWVVEFKRVEAVHG